MKLEDLKTEFLSYASDYDAVNLQRFFKTGPGEYGEGDVFIGVKMGPVRLLAKKYTDFEITEVEKLLKSPIHEHRMCALIILVNKFRRADESLKKDIYKLYLNGLNNNLINNWDLVDVTCEHIVGEYLYDRPRTLIYDMARSQNLWERRVAIIATFNFIKKGEYTDTIKIADILINDKHDLIHKAVGWMLREVGKRVSEGQLLEYLDLNAHKMPRTMLRYAIEKLDPAARAYYMNKKG